MSDEKNSGKKGFTVRDTRSHDMDLNPKALPEKSKSTIPQMPESFPQDQRTFNFMEDLNQPGFQSFPKPEEQISIYDRFLFEESPRFKSKLSALAVNEATAAIIDDKKCSQNVRERIKNRAADYFLREVAESTLSHSNMTKNLMLKTSFEMSTGLTDEYLNEVFKDGEDITDAMFLGLGNDLSESYSKWAQSMTFRGMSSLTKDKSARSVLEDRVNKWNFDFKLGLKEDDLKEDEKLIKAYFQGASRNKAYMDSQKVQIYQG